LADGLSYAPDNIGISNDGNIFWKNYPNSWGNQYGGTISGKPLQSIGNGLGLGLLGYDIINTFGNLDNFQSMEDFWDTYFDWSFSTMGGGIGATIGGTICVELGPGAIVCAAAGSYLGSKLGSLFSNYHLNDCEVFSDNFYVRATAGHRGPKW